jgi:uncharacterized membrane protein
MEFVSIRQSELIHFRNLETQKNLRDQTIKFGNILKFFGMALFGLSCIALLQSVLLIMHSEPGEESSRDDITSQSSFISFLRTSVSSHNYYASDD